MDIAMSQDVSPIFLLNFVNGFIPGVFIDAWSGCVYNLHPESISTSLVRNEKK
jgi:hypothetical protein